MDKNYYCVIMAGGIGSRFWPMSKSSKPKQFLDIMGTGKTFIQMTYDRFLKICPQDNIYIVTNKENIDLVKEQLHGIKDEMILLEPYRRNTAPCIAYANYKIKKRNTEALIVVAPSDHLIVNEDLFISYIKQGFEFVGENDALMTLGIVPNRPDTGYGYIQINNELKVTENAKLKKVKTFTEKPNLEMAKFFVQTGEFLWNSGIFIWSLKSIHKAFQKSLPDVNSLFREAYKHFDTENEEKETRKTYAACTNISIDYGIMEKADNVYSLCTDFGWSDLGTWGSLYENSEKDEFSNVIKGANVMAYKSTGNIIKTSKDKLVVLQGLDGFIVVDTGEVLLICKKEQEQQIRQIVNDVKLEKGEEFV
ncbi:MAG: mannose-1-phosphate guanylyltransferase [Bacteroidetes bacterium GWF2_38_335]|nr:MAG: mannose-1-phosphate guanylyltransferase [Bacteroidetes bacterium GWF2_38_335]OFY79711.1 MAG: mannose-1-phosphate guanylyltransferase [Bacteroidetes bacterium RIFOXYA12_FULL_38_20]HBS87583.1 mannose-1-phosphate guanylyltransferase [Bacteroidales bacterium]